MTIDTPSPRYTRHADGAIVDRRQEDTPSTGIVCYVSDPDVGNVLAALLNLADARGCLNDLRTLDLGQVPVWEENATVLLDDPPTKR